MRKISQWILLILLRDQIWVGRILFSDTADVVGDKYVSLAIRFLISSKGLIEIS